MFKPNCLVSLKKQTLCSLFTFLIQRMGILAQEAGLEVQSPHLSQPDSRAGSPSRQVALCRVLAGRLGQARLASVLCARPGLTLNQSQRPKCVPITNRAKRTGASACAHSTARKSAREEQQQPACYLLLLPLQLFHPDLAGLGAGRTLRRQPGLRQSLSFWTQTVYFLVLFGRRVGHPVRLQVHLPTQPGKILREGRALGSVGGQALSAAASRARRINVPRRKPASAGEPALPEAEACSALPRRARP